MSQILFQFGPFVLPAYGFFVGLALVLGMVLGELRGREIGLARFAVLDLAFVVALAGILGADIFHFAFAGGNLPGGMGRSFFGGLVGGSLAGIVWARWRRVPLLPALDCLFLYLPLGHALGRIGCWFYGCCHGKICSASVPFAAAFPKVETGEGRLIGSPAYVRHLNSGLLDSGAEQSLSVYPTQLLSALLLAGVFLALRVFSTKKRVTSRPGAIVCLYLLLSGFARFAEEFLRDHTRYWNLLTNAQIVSLLTAAAGAAGLYLLVSRQPVVQQQRSRKPADAGRRRSRAGHG